MPAEIPNCALDETGLSEQRSRYERLAPSVDRIERSGEVVLVEFGDTLDRDELDQALAVERDCCPFFEFRFEGERRLHVTVREAEQLPALDAITHAFEAA